MKKLLITLLTTVLMVANVSAQRNIEKYLKAIDPEILEMYYEDITSIAMEAKKVSAQETKDSLDITKSDLWKQHCYGVQLIVYAGITEIERDQKQAKKIYGRHDQILKELKKWRSLYSEECKPASPN